jgi:hypothetical protein
LPYIKHATWLKITIHSRNEKFDYYSSFIMIRCSTSTSSILSFSSQQRIIWSQGARILIMLEPTLVAKFSPGQMILVAHDRCLLVPRFLKSSFPENPKSSLQIFIQIATWSRWPRYCLYQRRVQMTAWLPGHVGLVHVATWPRGIRAHDHVATWINTCGHMATWK